MVEAKRFDGLSVFFLKSVAYPRKSTCLFMSIHVYSVFCFACRFGRERIPDIQGKVVLCDARLLQKSDHKQSSTFNEALLC